MMYTYYLIQENTLVKGDHEEGDFLVSHAFVWRNGQWAEINPNEINDRLMGFDPSEPAGSPYGIYDDDIMDEIREITEEEAKSYM